MSFLDPYQGAVSHRNLGNLRNGRREKKGGKREREQRQNICLSSSEKRKSAAQKSSPDIKYNTHTHTHRETGGVMLLSRCPALNHSGKLQRELKKEPRNKENKGRRQRKETRTRGGGGECVIQSKI